MKTGVGAKAIEREILAQLATRARDATVCPSEIARALAADWRPLMEPVRDAARRLREAGVVRVTQRGREVDPARARGPIRLGLAH